MLCRYSADFIYIVSVCNIKIISHTHNECQFYELECHVNLLILNLFMSYFHYFVVQYKVNYLDYLLL